MTRPAMTRGTATPRPTAASERPAGSGSGSGSGSGNGSGNGSGLGPGSGTGTRPAATGRRRFALRARAVRRARWRWKLGVPLAVALAVGGAWFVWSGPVLVLRSVTVRGVPAAEVGDIRAAAGLPVGRPMVRLDLASAQHRVSALREVRAVSVGRSWPTGVVVTVRLRTPVAVVKDAAGTLHLADSTGTTYAEVATAPKDLPLVSADAADPAAVQSVVGVLAALPARLRVDVTTAQAKGPDGVTLTLAGLHGGGPVTVMWGSAAETPLKATVFEAVRRQNPKAKRFDVSAPGAPSVG